MKSIKIDQIEIRLKGISSGLARPSIEGLGNELMVQLSREPHLFLKKRRLIHINKIDSDIYRTSENMNSSDMRHVMAGKIADLIFSRVRDIS